MTWISRHEINYTAFTITRYTYSKHLFGNCNTFLMFWYILSANISKLIIIDGLQANENTASEFAQHICKFGIKFKRSNSIQFLLDNIDYLVAWGNCSNGIDQKLIEILTIIDDSNKYMFQSLQRSSLTTCINLYDWIDEKTL